MPSPGTPCRAEMPPSPPLKSAAFEKQRADCGFYDLVLCLSVGRLSPTFRGHGAKVTLSRRPHAPCRGVVMVELGSRRREEEGVVGFDYRWNLWGVYPEARTPHVTLRFTRTKRENRDLPFEILSGSGTSAVPRCCFTINSNNEFVAAREIEVSLRQLLYFTLSF